MTKNTLRAKCSEHAIPFTEKDGIKELSRKLSVFFLKDGDIMTSHRLDNSPQLCYPYKNLSPFEQDFILTKESWIAEEKYDGERVFFYHFQNEMRLFSRHLSLTNFLPISYKVNLTNHSLPYFILDCEIVHKDGGGIAKVVSVLHRKDFVLTEDSPLQLKVFDILGYDYNNLIHQPLIKRLPYRHKVCEELSKHFTFVKEVPYVKENKTHFFSQVIENGGEGIVLKNLLSPYYVGERKKNAFVKWKRTVEYFLHEPIYAFIYDATAGEGEFKGLIGAVKLYVYKDNDVVHIATVSGMPLSLRKQMSAPDGTLHLDYMYKVVRVSGQYFSSLSKRLMHAIVTDWDVSDKEITDCILPKEVLDYV